MAEVPAKSDCHITIAALSTTAEIDLSHEVSLVKASLLYADRVTLASPKVMLLAGSAAVFSEDSHQRTRAVAEAIGAFDEASAVPALYEELKRKARLSPEERLMKARLEMTLRRTGDELGRVLDNTLDEAGAQELVPAFEAGLVDLDPLGATGDDHEAFFDNVVAHLQTRLTALVSETQTSYPLFDDEAGGLLRAMVEEGHVPNPDFQLANEIGHLTPHTLRRTFASLLAEVGVPPRRAMYLIGHTDPTLTMRVYQQVMDMGGGALEALERVLGCPPDEACAIWCERAVSGLKADSPEKSVRQRF